MKNSRLSETVCFFFFFLVLSGACTIPFFFESPSMFYKLGLDKTLLRGGKIFGILSFVLVIFQPVFVSRFSYLMRVFGQKRLMSFHRGSAIVLTAAAILHPVFILWSEDFTFFPLELRYWPAFLGAGILLMVVATTFVSYFRQRLRLSWSIWRTLHRIGTPVLTAGMIIHVLEISKSFESGPPFIFLLICSVCSLFLFLRRWLLYAVQPKK